MKTLTIRGLPDDVHERLKERAKRNRRSLNQEVIAELARSEEDAEKERKALGRERVRRANEKIEAMRATMTDFMTTEEIRAAIDEGRR